MCVINLDHITLLWILKCNYFLWLKEEKINTKSARRNFDMIRNLDKEVHNVESMTMKYWFGYFTKNVNNIRCSNIKYEFFSWYTLDWLFCWYLNILGGDFWIISKIWNSNKVSQQNTECDWLSLFIICFPFILLIIHDTI